MTASASGYIRAEEESMIELSAREWRKVWEQLYNEGNLNLAGRIDHDLGHIWNSENWDRRVSLDFSDDDLRTVRAAAERAGIRGNW